MGLGMHRLLQDGGQAGPVHLVRHCQHAAQVQLQVETDIEQARDSVPRVPELVSGLKEGQAALRRELESTRKKLGRVRVDQSIADFKLKELDLAIRDVFLKLR